MEFIVCCCKNFINYFKIRKHVVNIWKSTIENGVVKVEILLKMFKNKNIIFIC